MHVAERLVGHQLDLPALRQSQQRRSGARLHQRRIPECEGALTFFPLLFSIGSQSIEKAPFKPNLVILLSKYFVINQLSKR